MTRKTLAAWATTVAAFVGTAAPPPTFACAAPAVAADVLSDDPTGAAQPAAVVVVDERAYLLGRLEWAYENWPLNVDDPAFPQQVADLRARLEQARQRALDYGVGEDVAALCQDAIDSADVWVDVLAQIRNVDEEMRRQRDRDLAESVVDGLVESERTYDEARDAGKTRDEAGDEAIGAALLDFIFSEGVNAIERDLERQAAVDAQLRRITQQLDYSLGRARLVSQGTAGLPAFDLEVDQVGRVGHLARLGAREQLLPLLEEKVARQPGNPMYRVMRNDLIASDPATGAATALACAMDTVAAAELVPPAAEYDYRRDAFAVSAAWQASLARDKEAAAGADPLGSTDTSRYAVGLWEAALRQHDMHDPAGTMREGLAWALMADNRLHDAWAKAHEVNAERGGTVSYAHHFAALMSRVGEYDHSLTWLRHAMALGYTDLRTVWADPAFDPLRENRPDAYVELLTVNTSANIVWGVLNDDVTLTNNSAFTLTNVSMEVRLVQEEKVWVLDLTVPTLAPGQTHTWTNCVSIPGSRLTDSTMTVRCDQSA